MQASASLNPARALQNSSRQCLWCQTRRVGRWSAQSFSSTSRRRDAAQPTSHYDLFPESLPKGPPPAGPFAIDVKHLRSEFLRKQAVAHPDRHPQELKARAEATSARINEAFKTLQDPLLRTQYLLSLRGIDVAEDETGKVDDQSLLLDVLESQEEIEAASKEEDLETLKQSNDARLQESVQIIDDAFARDDLETAKREAIRMKYWTNINDGIQNWEPGKPVTLIH